MVYVTVSPSEEGVAYVTVSLNEGGVARLML